MRGKHGQYRRRRLLARNIPAYAGKTNSSWLSAWAVAGTSPRMRGKPWFALTLNTPLGNIPAYAGKTRGEKDAGQFGEEHPRVCGENNVSAEVEGLKNGTSPRMRGKPAQSHQPDASTRNIPAYAGKTPLSPLALLAAKEHPRVCGENPLPAGRCVTVSGTSPRMRGKPSGNHWDSAQQGNIPAYAGKTFFPLTRVLTSREHPRVCGENYLPAPTISLQ